MKCRRWLCLVAAVCFLFGMTACGNHAEQSESLSPEWTEYRFAGYYDWFLGKAYYEDVMSYLESDNNSVHIGKEYGEKAYREGEYLIVQATSLQRDALINQNKDLIRQVSAELSAQMENFDMKYTDDYSSAEIYLDQEQFEDVFSKEAFDTGGNVFALISLLTANRVLLTGDCDSCVAVTILNSDSGFIVSNALYPYEAITLTSEDWITSNTQDVEVPSQNAGYTRIPASIAGIDEQKIIFQPQEGTPYAQDEKLALCLDSVYAENVFLPYHLNVGDEVFLLLDGTYALHEDGDEIPDIAPLAVIPSQYVRE